MACQYSLTPLAHLDTPAEELQQELQKNFRKHKKESMQAEHIHRQHAILAETNCSALMPSNSSRCFDPLFQIGPWAIPPFIQKLRTSPQLQLLS